MYTPRSSGQAAAAAKPEVALRTMRILWVVFLITVGLFVLVTYFARPSAETVAEVRQANPAVLLALAALGLSSVVASFIFKAGFYRRAAEQQQPAVLQTGFILALVLCEAAVLMGLVGLFVTWNDYAYGLFALGFVGELLHFPRREPVMSAYFKQGM
jgi:F0F1-type ATP synthase membrane subunit c/vacuolar-type H+-ATPase subunit K